MIKKTFGQILFPNVNIDKLKEFDRTVLSVLLYYYIKDNRYDKFVMQQSGDNKLTKETFDSIREFMKLNFNTPEKERLLLYYMVINDLGKSQQVIDTLKEKGIETVDHDLLLNYLLQFGMLPTLNSFSDEIINNITDYETLIHEFNQSGYNGCQAVLLYYSPSLLSNANGYYKRNNSVNPIHDSLKTCLPFMQQVMHDTRSRLILIKCYHYIQELILHQKES